MSLEILRGGGGRSTNVTIAALYVPSTGLDEPSVSFNRLDLVQVYVALSLILQLILSSYPGPSPHS